jgi:predicted nucleotide-binding protein
MAKKTSSTPPPGPPQVSPTQGIDLLNRQIAAAETLLNAGTIPSDEYSAWELVTRNLLEKAFGTNSPNVSSVRDVGKYGSFPMDADESWWEDHRRRSLTTQVSKLRGLVELLKTEVQLQDAGVPTVGKAAVRGHRIFLVHGHDEVAVHETARFLEKLEQDVLILREQPNEGRTIIEKFEDYSDVGFAVVLLTADDRGGPAGCSFEDQLSRARQNVIFELGYFIGRLGRNRVCALYRPRVDIPSDYAGVLYIELDDRGAWKLELAKELKAASFPVDMNKAL